MDFPWNNHKLMTSIPCLPSPADALAAQRLVRALRLHETRRLKRMGPRADGGAGGWPFDRKTSQKYRDLWHWCEICMSFMGLMWDLYEFYGIDVGFVWDLWDWCGICMRFIGLMWDLHEFYGIDVGFVWDLWDWCGICMRFMGLMWDLCEFYRIDVGFVWNWL